jgi:hypothetical protein
MAQKITVAHSPDSDDMDVDDLTLGHGERSLA